MKESNARSTDPLLRSITLAAAKKRAHEWKLRVCGGKGYMPFEEVGAVLLDEILRLEDQVTADAERYRFVQLHGFPVKNQTAHTPDHRWVVVVDHAVFYGCTPSFAIDAAMLAAKRSGSTK